MATWVALLRGINVGGKNTLPMAEFRLRLASLNFRNVKTYIQTGNVVFQSKVKSAASLAEKIGSCVHKS